MKKMPVEARSKRTRAVIMSTTLDMMREHRLEDITLSKIAQESGYTRQGIYQHFDDRDDIAYHAVIAKLQEIFDEIPEHPNASVALTFEPLICYMIREGNLHRNLIGGPIADHLADFVRDNMKPICELYARRWAPGAPEAALEDIAFCLGVSLMQLANRWLAEGISCHEARYRLERLRSYSDELVANLQSSSPAASSDPKTGVPEGKADGFASPVDTPMKPIPAPSAAS